MATEQVFIEFITNDSALDSSTDALEQQGKITKQNGEEFKKTNTEIQKQVKTLDALAATTSKIGQAGVPLKKTLSDLNTQVKGLSKSFMKDFQQGAAEALRDAGVSAKEFEDALSDAAGESASLKQQLRQMVEQLGQMKVLGQDNTEQYRALAQQAGELKDAIADANQEVKNFGSDTSTIDGLIDLAGGLAGGFAVVQGAAALFGDESEELQKTLLKVNAAMAVLQGLQQIQTLLQKESAAATLANVIATKAQTAAQVIMNVVIGTSTGLLKGLRIAFAATGVGLLVLGVIALVNAFKSSNDEIEKANDILEKHKDLIESTNEAIARGASIAEERAKANNKLASEITKIQGRTLQDQKKSLIELNIELADQRDQLDQNTKAWGLLNSQILENNSAISKLDIEVINKSIELEKQLADERLKSITAGIEARLALTRKNSKEELNINKELVQAQLNEALNTEALTQGERIKLVNEANKKLKDLDREFRKVLQQDRISGIEAQLEAESEKRKQLSNITSQAEIDLQKKLIQEKADLELLTEGLTANQILEIKTKSLNDQLALQREFNNEQKRISLEGIVSRNNAELQRIELSDEKKLALTIENITAQAQIEADAALGNNDKIKEINAKRDRDIKAARLASIEETVNEEIRLTTARSGVLLRGYEKELDEQSRIRNAGNEFEKRRVEKQLGIQRKSVDEQIKLIDTLTAYSAGAIAKRIDALNEERAKGLISQKEYNVRYEELVDEQSKAFEDGEKRKQELLIETQEAAKRAAIELVETSLDAVSQVVGVLDSLFQLQADKENQSLERRKAEIEELRQAGAITEKEAQSRAKRLEADEKRIRQQQAQREKQIAIFNAAIAVPQAVLKGLSTGGPILAAVYGALALAQLLIVSSRPIPKFGKGKKNSYEGLAEVGETGTELIESNGRMYVADKSQVVWLGKNDKVYNPQETIDMLSSPAMSTERVMMPAAKNSSMKIDYDKFGKAVAKHIETNVYVDGIKEQAIRQREFENWNTKRRSY